MKKAVAVLAFFLALSATFSSGITEDGIYSGVTNRPYRPAALDGGINYSLYGNAASLAEGRFRIQIPYVESSSYNVSAALKDSGAAQALSGLTKFQFTKENLIAYIAGLAASVGTGYNNVISADASIGVQVGNMAFGLNAGLGVHSMPPVGEDGELQKSYSAAGNGYVPEMNMAFTFAYGKRVMDNGSVTLDIGGAVRYAQKAYLLQLKASDLPGIQNGGLETLASRGGFAFPVDLGLTLGLAENRVKISASANNLNGLYYMKNYEGIKNALLLSNGLDKYVLYSPFTVNISASYSPNFRIVNPKVSVAFSGINLFFKNETSGDKPMLELLKYLDAGIELSLYGVVNFRASYRYGYPDFAVGINVYGNKVELSYGFREAGTRYGLKPVDRLTVRVALGFEKPGTT